MITQKSDQIVHFYFRAILSIATACLLLFLHSCSPLKNIPEGEYLHIKNSVKLESTNIPKSGLLKSELAQRISPDPGYGLFKWRLNIHNGIKEPKREKGLRNWLKNKIGREPEIYSGKQADVNCLRMEKHLKDEGYFKAIVKVDTTIKKRKVHAKYLVRPGPSYRLRNVIFRSDSSNLGEILVTAQGNSVLKEEERYRTDDILFERQRLSKYAADRGYLGIGKNAFGFYLDTLKKQAVADVYIKIIPRKDQSDYHSYTLNQTWVFQNYSLDKYHSQSHTDTLEFEGLRIVQDGMFIGPEALSRSILQRKGDLYSRKLSDYTLSRLLDLGVYKFVNIKYMPTEDSISRITDRYIYLTPGNIRDLTAEIRANTRTGNFLGSGVVGTYTDRNFFGGAERFEASISGELETQFGDDGPLINSVEAGIQLKLLIPSFFPFSRRQTERLFTPKTRIGLAFDYEKRIEFYAVNTFTLQFGYIWRSSLSNHHQFFPLVINRINTFEKTEALEDLLRENPTLRSSFENVYITGAQYVFTRSNRAGRIKSPYYYFKTNIETSGNAMYLLSLTLKGKQEDPYSFLGFPFAQFIKTDVDFRYYYPIQSSTLVSRFFAGIGYAYGNQNVMPYVKQYYSGGTNGIRAFRIRTIGPGSYVNPLMDSGENEFIDQTGDIKLEANLEYRFKLWKYLKGALFVDAGNIWLLRDENDAREGGTFHFNTFLREIAIGTGMGLRLDINAFVFRLDAAFPLRKPFLPENQRWVIEDVAFFNKSWRKENLVWNLALGYPF